MAGLAKTLTIVPVAVGFTIPATPYDPELTIHPDGTDLMMVWAGGLRGRRVTAVGVTVEASPYRFQACRYADGTIHNVAPHVLHKD